MDGHIWRTAPPLPPLAAEADAALMDGHEAFIDTYADRPDAALMDGHTKSA